MSGSPVTRLWGWHGKQGNYSPQRPVGRRGGRPVAWQRLCQPQHVTVIDNPQWLKGSKGTHRTPQCSLHVSTTLRGSCPPDEQSPLHLPGQHSPRNCTEKRGDLCPSAHKSSTKSSHVAAPTFRKLSRCRPPTRSEVKKPILLKRGNAPPPRERRRGRGGASGRHRGTWGSLSSLEGPRQAC